MRKALIVLVLIAMLPVLAFSLLYMRLSNPEDAPLPLPPELPALNSPTGQAQLLEAEGRTDHEGLMAVFEPQQKGSWCGVASSVAVLRARGATLDQPGFFTPEASEIRSFFTVTFGGMTLPSLGAMIESHGATTEVHHAGTSSEDAFRAEVARNLSTAGDWLIVNYDRVFVGESGGGHISPLSAYDADSDQVLLLDTAGHKYPPHWVSVAELFTAMQTIDPETERTRGWVVVR
ncbi:MAG: phytochelatin synthase family protein [Myxococcota bacterium]